MSTYESNGTLLGRLVTWILVAILAIAALKLAFWVVGAVMGVGFWLLFTLGPILLVGWLVIKVLRYFTRDRTSYPAA